VCSLLEQITTHTPSTEEPDIWYSSWNAILNTFPAFGTRRYSDLIMEIVKVIDDYNPNLDRTVLIFEIKSSCHWWECGKETLIQHIGYQADVAFSELRTAGQKYTGLGRSGRTGFMAKYRTARLRGPSSSGMMLLTMRHPIVTF